MWKYVAKISREIANMAIWAVNCHNDLSYNIYGVRTSINE